MYELVKLVIYQGQGDTHFKKKDNPIKFCVCSFKHKTSERVCSELWQPVISVVVISATDLHFL